MKKIRFNIHTGYVNCVHEIEEEFEDDITEEELNEYSKELVWEYISVTHEEVKKDE